MRINDDTLSKSASENYKHEFITIEASQLEK